MIKHIYVWDKSGLDKGVKHTGRLDKIHQTLKENWVFKSATSQEELEWMQNIFMKSSPTLLGIKPMIEVSGWDHSSQFEAFNELVSKFSLSMQQSVRLVGKSERALRDVADDAYLTYGIYHSYDLIDLQNVFAAGEGVKDTRLREVIGRAGYYSAVARHDEQAIFDTLQFMIYKQRDPDGAAGVFFGYPEEAVLAYAFPSAGRPNQESIAMSPRSRWFQTLATDTANNPAPIKIILNQIDAMPEIMADYFTVVLQQPVDIRFRLCSLAHYEQSPKIIEAMLGVKRMIPQIK